MAEIEERPNNPGYDLVQLFTVEAAARADHDFFSLAHHIGPDELLASTVHELGLSPDSDVESLDESQAAEIGRLAIRLHLFKQNIEDAEKESYQKLEDAKLRKEMLASSLAGQNIIIRSLSGSRAHIRMDVPSENESDVISYQERFAVADIGNLAVSETGIIVWPAYPGRGQIAVNVLDGNGVPNVELEIADALPNDFQYSI